MSPTDPRLLRALGIQRSYTDHTGARKSAPAATLRAITSALTKHLNPADPLRDLAAKQLRAGVAPCTVAWSDRPATATLILSALPTTTISIHASLPNGGFRGWAFDPQDLESSPTTLVDGAPALALHLPIPDDLPLGATPLAITLGKRTLNTTLLSAPRANQPTQWIHRERSIGIFTPTYSLRSTEDRIGIGNLSDLADLGAWAASQGCGYLGTLPLLASITPDPPAPYAPVSRCLWNDLLVHPPDAPGFDDCPEAQRAWIALSPRKGQRRADYAAAAQRHRAVMQPLADHFFAALKSRPKGVLAKDFAATMRDRPGVTLDAHAHTTALSTHLNESPQDANLRLFGQYAAIKSIHSLRTSLHAQSMGLYLDLPVGVHPQSIDVTAWPTEFATDLAVGAPPDAHFPSGQGWGFPPTHPLRASETAHAAFRAACEHHCAAADILRVDHVMGLRRLWVYPKDSDPAQGTYLKMPGDELLAVLLTAAAQSGTAIVGEDLGIVPRQTRTDLREHNLAGMSVAQFNLPTKAPPRNDPILTPRPTDLAALNTHDTPPFAGWTESADIPLRTAAGVLPATLAKAEARHRAAQLCALQTWAKRQGLSPTELEDPTELALLLLKSLANSRAAAVLINLEDLWAEHALHNIPGTSTAHPNWTLRHKRTLHAITRSATLAAAVQEVTQIRRGSPPHPHHEP